MVDCPTCEGTFENQRGVAIHHAHVHGESIATAEFECDNCSTTFERQATKVSGGSVFCGEQCKIDFGRIDITKEELYSKYWGACKTTQELASEFGCSPNTVQRRMREYGIPMVRSEHTHSAWIFNRRSTEWLRREYKEREKSTYQIAHENSVYFDWVRIQLHKRGIEPRNPGYVGYERGEWPSPEYDYGPEWPEVRDTVLEKYNHTCQGCQTPESELEQGLHVHHIKPFPEFEVRENANAVENLIPYCPDCHRKWEGVPLTPV